MMLVVRSLVIACLLATPALAQDIVLDRPVQAGPLTVYASLEEGVYYYAPTRARLATTSTGLPQVSFLRYVENVREGEGSLREGEGGGIFHAVVQLGASEDERREAEQDLKRRVPGAVLRGPVVFRSGSFGLVTSFIDESGELATQVVGLGTAPVLDGGKAAVSIRLTRRGATLLWQSFQTATPDVSFLFEMELKGYRAPMRAVIEADMERVYSHRAFEAGIVSTYLQTEIDSAFEELRSQGAIRLVQVGEDEDVERLAQTAYSKLTDLVFQPGGEIPGQGPAGAGQRKSALDRASELLDRRRKEVRDDNTRIREENRQIVERARQDATRLRAMADRRPAEASEASGAGFLDGLASLAEFQQQVLEAAANEPEARPDAPEQPQQQELPEFAAVVSYRMKETRQTGTYRVDLNKYTIDSQPLRFDENIGDLRRYLDDEAIFKNVNLDDPLYRQREVNATLTGVSAATFDRALAFVNLQLRKTHESGDVTLEEKLIDRAAFNETGNNFRFVYGWKGDRDRQRWQSFEYRALWGLHEGEPIQGEWTPTDLNVIPLRPPFEERTLELDAGDGSELAAAKVRSVRVSLWPGREAETPLDDTTLDTSRGQLSGGLEIAVPRSAPELYYEIEWRLRGNRTLTSGRQRLESSILYLDELPEGEAS